MILTDSIPPWLNLPMNTTYSADVALPYLGLRPPQTGLESSQHGPLPWAMLSIRPASMSRSHYYNGAVWRSSTMYASGLGGLRAHHPEAESSDRTHRYATQPPWLIAREGTQ